MNNANLSRANLDHADLDNADLSYTDLSRANLNNANLNQAKLGFIKGLTPEQLKKAKNWQYAYYDEDFAKKLD